MSAIRNDPPVTLRQLALRTNRGRAMKSEERSLHTSKDGNGLVVFCAVCPKRTLDLRRREAPAYRSIWRVRNLAEGRVWFAAHVLTEMHAYYRNEPPMQEVEVFANGAFERRVRPVPFRYSARANLGGHAYVTDANEYFDVEIPGEMADLMKSLDVEIPQDGVS